MSWGWDPAAAGGRAGLESRAVRGESSLMACPITRSGMRAAPRRRGYKGLGELVININCRASTF